VRDQHSRVAGDAEKDIPHQPIVRPGSPNGTLFWFAHTYLLLDGLGLSSWTATYKPIVVVCPTNLEVDRPAYAAV
jgi:hypothetical protein